MSPDAVSVLVDTMEKGKDVILCCGDHERITSYRKTLNSEQHSITEESNYDILKKILTEDFDNIGVWAKLFPRNKIGSLRFVPGKGANEDKFFLIQYLLRNSGQIICIDQTLYGYYIRPGSAARSPFSHKTLDALYFANHIEDEVAEKVPAFLEYAKYNSLFTHLSILKIMLRQNKQKDEKELFHKIKQETLILSEETPWRWGHKLERIALRIGTPVYAICVHIYDGLKMRRVKSRLKYTQ